MEVVYLQQKSYLEVLLYLRQITSKYNNKRLFTSNVGMPEPEQEESFKGISTN